MGVVAVGEALDELVGAGQTAGVNQLLVGGVGVAPAEVFLDGAGEQLVLLQHHGHVVPEHLKIVVPDVDAAHFQGALADVVQAGDQLYQGRFAGTGATQNADRRAGGDVQVHFLQRPVSGSGGIAEAHVLKVDGAVGNLHDGVFRGGGQVRLLGEDLIAPLQRGAAHGQHDGHHGQHHERRKNLAGVGEHGAELAGGEAEIGVIAGGDDQMRADPRNGKHTAVDAQLHDGIRQRHDTLGLAEVLVNGAGYGGEFLGLPVFPDEGFDHPDAVDVLLHHIVHFVVGAEDPIENPEHLGNQAKQGADQNGQRHAVHEAQPHADAHGGNQRQNQHHGAADGHTDHHLEGVLQGRHVAALAAS